MISTKKQFTLPRGRAIIGSQFEYPSWVPRGAEMIPFESDKVMLARKERKIFGKILPLTFFVGGFFSVAEIQTKFYGGVFMFLNSLLVSYQDYWKDKLPDGTSVKHYDYPDVWTSFAKDGLRSVFLWATLAIAAILLIVGFIVRMKKSEAFKAYLTVAISLAIGYAVTVIVTMFSVEIMDMVENELVYDLVLYPAIALGVVVIVGAAAIYLGTLYGGRAQKITFYASICGMAAALIALLACIGVFYARNIAEDGYYNSELASVDQVVLYVCAGLLIALVGALAVLLGLGDKKGFDSKSIAYAGVCIAMSFALSYVRLFKLPQGGSVTLASLLPLMIYSCMFGTRKGVFAGLIYGVLQAVQDPYIIHPAQFLLDYPIAFAAIGLAGAFCRVKSLDSLPQVQFALGAILASALRYLSHVLSGVFAFSAYAADAGMGAWVYSLAYNSFVFVDIAIAIAVGVVVFSSKTFVKEVRKRRPTEKKEPAPETGEDAAPQE